MDLSGRARRRWSGARCRRPDAERDQVTPVREVMVTPIDRQVASRAACSWPRASAGAAASGCRRTSGIAREAADVRRRSRTSCTGSRGLAAAARSSVARRDGGPVGPAPVLLVLDGCEPHGPVAPFLPALAEEGDPIGVAAVVEAFPNRVVDPPHRRGPKKGWCSHCHSSRSDRRHVRDTHARAAPRSHRLLSADPERPMIR